MVDIYWFFILFVFVIIMMGLLLPHLLSIFRIPRIFNQALSICIFLFVVGIIFQFQDNFNCDDRRGLFYPLYGIVFLILYKIADNVALKKLGRHMYYRYLLSRYYTNEKAEQSTLMENIAQILIFLMTFIIPYYSSFWIVKCWYSC